MRKRVYYLVIFTISLNLIFTNGIFGYEANFHEDLTFEAINKSDILIYLKENLDFELTQNSLED